MPGDQSEDDKEDPGFTVSDRRGSGESESPTDGAVASAETDAWASASQAQALPPIDFHTFILSLGSSALFHLGELDGPEGHSAEPDLPLAKHSIDVIAMIQAKTQGNLTPPEANLLESLLYDLRLRYVEKTKAAAPPVT